MDKKNSKPAPICPKCKGNMEAGYLAGVKYTSFFAYSDLKKRIGKSVAVTAYKCQNCGYCEIYADGKMNKTLNLFT